MIVPVIHIVISYVPIMQGIFHTNALNIIEFLIVVTAFPIVFFAVEIENLYPKNISYEADINKVTCNF